ncbi:hypothetical protein A7A08_02937 [Methyloligella halotolerans]|uniref:Uncharacterized protein n=1 Tax=Methyloligella halotolerans TaxID=1177755 RepID=A0A1E2RVY8_9HYPH|nr:hypothetical protein [Methyloligella halotolerans]ODA66290.1 hypothetical protein A7A08_02937 [Methyloligella halotolerans]
MPRLLACLLVSFMIAATARPALAGTCQAEVDQLVKSNTTDLLNSVIEEKPELADISEEQLVIQSGQILLGSPRGDLKAHGWMMLLWYGGEEGRNMVAESGPTLETEEARAHLYYVMGLWQLRADDPETAAKGRELLSQVRDTGKVTFAPDEMWTMLLEECDLPE